MNAGISICHTIVCVINLLFIWFLIYQYIIMFACADPESFVRGGPNLITFFLVDEGMEDPNTAINGLISAGQLNAI